MNPFFVLDVPPDADDETIRKTYLEAIKKAPPEKDPERFRIIHQAYESIRNESQRIGFRLFPAGSAGSSLTDSFLRHARWRPSMEPPDWETLKEFLCQCQIPPNQK